MADQVSPKRDPDDTFPYLLVHETAGGRVQLVERPYGVDDWLGSMPLPENQDNPARTLHIDGDNALTSPMGWLQSVQPLPDADGVL